MEILKKYNKIYVLERNVVYELFESQLSCKVFWTQIEMNWSLFVEKYKDKVAEDEWLKLVDFCPFFCFILDCESPYWILKLLGWLKTGKFELNEAVIDRLNNLFRVNKDQTIRKDLLQVLKKYH